MTRLARDCPHWAPLDGEGDGYGKCTGPLAKGWKNTLIRCRGEKWPCAAAGVTDARGADRATIA